MIIDENILNGLKPSYKNLILEYFKHLDINSRYSDNTIKSYIFDLKSISTYMQNDYDDAIIGYQNINNLYIRKMVAQWRFQEISVTTINRKISCFKSFYKWLRENNLSNNTVLENFSKSKMPKKLPRPLEIKNVFEFIDHVEKKSDSKYKKRNMAIIYLLYGCGMRISEMLSITHKTWKNHVHKNIKIKGKGSKERIIHLLPIVSKYVNEYINDKHEHCCENDYLFTNNKGQQLSATTIQKTFRIFRNQLGYDDTFTPHTLRHTFATHLLINGTDLRSISKLMGHSSIKSTQVYTKINKATIFKEAKKFNPKI